MSASGQPLRFGALIRVSTEKQEKQGESLRTQTKQHKSNVASLKGKIIEWYGGQEHATPGYEKGEIDRLLRDAARGRFDAIIVTNPDRWSRDNEKSKAGLNLFRQNGIRFFVNTMEQDLFDPGAKLYLGMSAEFGEYSAGIRNQQSIINRIERAKRGIPTAGHLPFARTFDRKTEKWDRDPKKHQLVKDVARRLLAGERMSKLAKEYGINHAFLHKVMTQRCGTDWGISFDCPNFNIKEFVPITIPRLLPDSTIKKILATVAANKTYTHGHIKNKYLLRSLIFCDHCGYVLSGQTNRQQRRYYRHSRCDRALVCTCITSKDVKNFVPGDLIELNVIHELFDMFGNPKAVERAVEKAIPSQRKIGELQSQRSNLEANIKKASNAIDRIVDSIGKGTLTDDEANPRLDKLREQKELHEQELRLVTDQLDHLPSKGAILGASQEIIERFQGALFPCQRGWRKIGMSDDDTADVTVDYVAQTLEQLDSKIELMSWEDKKALCQMVFAGKTPDGKRAGVYISFKNGRKAGSHWTFSIRGLFTREGVMPWEEEDDLIEIQEMQGMRGRKRRLTSSALH